MVKKLKHAAALALSNDIIHLLLPSEVKTVIWYGSSCYSTTYNDIDLFIVLKRHTYQAFSALTPLIKRYKKQGITLSLFIEGEDRILARGLGNFQFGRHGVYFISILSHGITLFGKNPFIGWSKKIYSNDIKKSLRYRIEEYFYRAEKIIKSGARRQRNFNEIKKIIFRIVIDLALYDDKISYKKVARTSHKALIESLVTGNYKRLSLITRGYLIDLQSRNINLHDLPEILDAIYRDYITLFKEQHEQSTF
jgi:hypothetical protein